MTRAIQLPRFVVIGWVVLSLSCSNFLLIDATAVTLGQGHGKVIRYILPDLYILCPKYLRCRSNGFERSGRSRCCGGRGGNEQKTLCHPRPGWLNYSTDPDPLILQVSLWYTIVTEIIEMYTQLNLNDWNLRTCTCTWSFIHLKIIQLTCSFYEIIIEIRFITKSRNSLRLIWR